MLTSKSTYDLGFRDNRSHFLTEKKNSGYGYEDDFLFIVVLFRLLLLNDNSMLMQIYKIIN